MVSIASCIVPVLLPHAAACGVDKSIAVKVLVFFCLALSRCYSCYDVLAVMRVASCRFSAVHSTTDFFLDVILLFSFFLHFFNILLFILFDV